MLTGITRFIKSTTTKGLSLLQCLSRTPLATTRIPLHLATARAPFHSSIPCFFSRTAAAMSKEFLCILPDKPDAQARRLEVRPKHLEGVKPLVAAGKIVVGGAMLNAHPAEGETPSFKGSMLICIVDTEEEAWEIIKNDIYVKSDVWDLDAAQVIPFKAAVRVGS
ncbi:hypothetical protein BJX66DRAFT_309563 [Aspergillus keveii]